MSGQRSGLEINSLPDLQAPPSSVFITGATGFIGQRLVSTLLEQGHTVRAMVRPDQFRDKRLPQGCEQVSVELTDVDKLTVIVAQSSAVIYCAGSVRGRNPADFATANITGVKTMLEALDRADHKPPMLLLSSLAASRPKLSDYACSKFEGEQLCQSYPLLPWTIFRPSAVYGPGDREMLPVLKLIRRGLLAHAGPRDQRLSLLHVDDLVSAIIAWLSVSRECEHKIFAIDDGTPGGYSWLDIGEAVSDGNFRTLLLPRSVLQAAAAINLMLSWLLAYAPMLTPGKVRELIQSDWLCDNSEFTDISSWQPRWDLKQGAAQLFKPHSNQSSG